MSESESALLNLGNLEKIELFNNSNHPDEFKRISPSLITMDLTWNCNFNCKGCIDTVARDNSPVVRKNQGGSRISVLSDKRDGPVLNKQIADSIIEYVKDSANSVKGLQMMGGEVLMHPNIDDILNKLGENEIQTAIITNGVLIKDHVRSLVSAFSTQNSMMRVSINGWESYSKRIGANSNVSPRDKLMEGLKLLSEEFLVKGIESPPVVISTVAFKDAQNEIPEIAENIARTGITNYIIIQERDATSKRIYDNDDRPKLIELCKEANKKGKKINSKFQAKLTDNLLKEREPQSKTYQPCPSTFFKALVGADGWIYLCSDQRGVKTARTVDISKYSNSFKSAWESTERIEKTLSYAPLNYCHDLLCLRHDANVKMHSLRCYKQWYNVGLLEIKSRKESPWWF